MAALLDVKTTRRTPARAAAARTRAVPSTLDRRVSSGKGPRDAARWNTPSQPRIAATSDPTSPRSAKTRSTPSGSTDARASLRMVARTGKPASVRTATSAEPRYPVAPVTSSIAGILGRRALSPDAATDPACHADRYAAHRPGPDCPARLRKLREIQLRPLVGPAFVVDHHIVAGRSRHGLPGERP